MAQDFRVFGDGATVMCFLQFLAPNSLSFRVINNYVTALKFYFPRYAWDVRVFEALLVRKMLRGIQCSTFIVPNTEGIVLVTSNSRDFTIM